MRVPTTTSTSPAPDPAPLVGPLPLTEAAVDDGDADGRSARSRSMIGVARAISGTSSERRPARARGSGDRLDVDRGLAAAGHAVEQDRRRVARSTAVDTASTAAAWSGLSAAAGRPRAAEPGGSAGERPTRALADLGADEAAPDERRRSPTSRAARRAPAGTPPSGRAARRVGVDARRARAARPLARAERPSRSRSPARAPRRPPTRGGEPQPSLVARAERRAEQRPVELDEPAVGERAQPAQQAGATLRRRRGRGPVGAPRQLVEEVQLHGAAARRSACDSRASPAGVTSATSSRRSSMPGGSIARITVASGAR